MDQLTATLPIDLTKKIVTDERAVNDFMNEDNVLSKEKSINLKMSETMANNLANVREYLELPDDASTFRLAIALYAKLIDDKKIGRELISHDKNGDRYVLEFENAT